MKAKVIDVHYRKDSESFPQWMKYEITLLYEDGTTEKIPAYGRDLQDALQRVVHDHKVEKISEKIEKVPLAVWLLLWFSYMGIIVSAYTITGNHWVVLGGVLGIGAVVASLNWWGKLRNRS
jgi:hypothetical protein